MNTVLSKHMNNIEDMRIDLAELIQKDEFLDEVEKALVCSAFGKAAEIWRTFDRIRLHEQRVNNDK